MSRPGVAFVAVNYNSTEDAVGFARLFDQAIDRLYGRAQVFLVDNSVGEFRGKLADALQEVSSCASCIGADANLGYFGGAQFGLELLKAQSALPRWLVVSNVDVKFDPVALVSALERLDSTTVGVVAPSILSRLTGRELNPYMRQRPSVLRMRALKWVYSNYSTMLAYEWLARWKGRLYRRFRAGSGQTKDQTGTQVAVLRTESIYAGHGSMLIFSDEYFRRGGSLFHSPLLFGEEITVSETALRIRLPVLWIPSLLVLHAEHVSVGKLPSRQMHRYLKEATAYCADTFF